MNKSLVVGLALTLSSSIAFAQTPVPANGTPATEYTELTSATKTAGATQLTSATQTTSATKATTATRPTSRLFTQEQFEQRWEKESQMYRDAGIDEDKIKEIHDLNSRVWKARAEGNKADFQKIMKERQQILTQEEIGKIRDLRRKQMDKILATHQRNSTGTKAVSPGTN